MKNMISNQDHLSFKQIDLNLSRFEYVVEDTGLRIIKKTLTSTREQFVSFENIGSEVTKEREVKYVWLILSVLFFLITCWVFFLRISGRDVAETAEASYLAAGILCFVIYVARRRNVVLLVQDDGTHKVEFVGLRIYRKRLDQFMAELGKRKNDYLQAMYRNVDGLTLQENICCINGGIQPDDGLFLKKLTKHAINKLTFQSESAEGQAANGICSVTTEKKRL